MDPVTLALAFAAVTQNLELPPGLLSAVCHVESNHDIRAMHYSDGNGDSLGICQIKLSTARLMGFGGSSEELRLPAANVFYAGRYLKHQLARYAGDPVKALSAYNAGTARLHLNKPYVYKVITAWEQAR